MSYRFALRGAALLAREKIWEPGQAQALLRAMYTIRSAIVHSGQQLSDLGKDQKKLLQKLGIQPYKFPQQCENIVRDILRTYVLRQAKGQSIETIITDLESYIVSCLASQSDSEVEQTHK